MEIPMTTNAQVTTTQVNSEKPDQTCESIDALIREAMLLYNGDWHVRAAEYFLLGLRTHPSIKVRMFFFVERATECTPEGTTLEGTFEERLLQFVGQAHTRESFEERLRDISRRFCYIA